MATMNLFNLSKMDVSIDPYTGEDDEDLSIPTPDGEVVTQAKLSKEYTGLYAYLQEQLKTHKTYRSLASSKGYVDKSLDYHQSTTLSDTFALVSEASTNYKKATSYSIQKDISKIRDLYMNIGYLQPTDSKQYSLCKCIPASSLIKMMNMASECLTLSKDITAPANIDSRLIEEKHNFIKTSIVTASPQNVGYDNVSLPKLIEAAKTLVATLEEEETKKDDENPENFIDTTEDKDISDEKIEKDLEENLKDVLSYTYLSTGILFTKYVLASIYNVGKHQLRS